MEASETTRDKTMFAGSFKYGIIGKIIEMLSRFSILLMRSLSFDATPALSRNLAKGKNTGKPYVKPVSKDEWLLHEIRPHKKIKRKQEEEQTLLREKKKVSMKKLLSKITKSNPEMQF